MKQYKVVTFKVVHQKKAAALECILNYLEEKREAGFKVEQILQYNDEQIELLCSESGSYCIEDDPLFSRLI